MKRQRWAPVVLWWIAFLAASTAFDLAPRVDWKILVVVAALFTALELVCGVAPFPKRDPS